MLGWAPSTPSTQVPFCPAPTGSHCCRARKDVLASSREVCLAPTLPSRAGCSLTGIQWLEIQGIQRKAALLRTAGLPPGHPGAGAGYLCHPAGWRNGAIRARIPPQDNTLSSPVVAASEPHCGTWAVHLDSLKALCSCPVPSLSCTDTEGPSHSCIFLGQTPGGVIKGCHKGFHCDTLLGWAGEQLSTAHPLAQPVPAGWRWESEGQR